MKPFLRPLLLLLPLVLAASARAAVDTSCLAPGADCTLREIATAAGVRIGAAVNPTWLAGEPAYAEAIAAEMNSLTAENVMKWPAIQPGEETWNFGPADAVVDFARAHGQRVRGHTLLWANPIRIPDWVNAAPDAETLEDWLDDHITTQVTRYADDVDQWDVVNEPLDNFGLTLYDNVFTQRIGPEYIARAFHLERAADPDAELFLNEVLVADPTTPRFDAFYDLVTDLLDQGVPIDGIGFQGHFIAGILQPTPEQFEAAIRAFTDLGLKVEITELDIVMPNQSPDRLEVQGRVYEALVGACLRVIGCDGVTTWGITDAHTWIDGTFGPGYVPLLLDEDYGRKPAYYGVRDALLERLALVPEPGAGWLLAAAALALRGAGRAARTGRRCP